MAITENPAAKLRSTVAELARTETELFSKRLVKRRELEEMEGAVGSKVLEAHLAGTSDAAAGEWGAKVATIKAVIDAFPRAAQAARAKRVESIRAVWRLEAAELRAEAGRKSAEADTRQKTTDKLIKQLQDFEGVVYVPTRPSLPERPVGGGGSGLHVVVPFPRTELLRGEANQLLARAGELENRKVQAAGSIQVRSLADLNGLALARGGSLRARALRGVRSPAERHR